MDTFNTCQFFMDDSYEIVKEHVPVEEAVESAITLATSVGARIGTTRRVIITDAGDCISWEWQYDKGVVFGPALPDLELALPENRLPESDKI